MQQLRRMAGQGSCSLGKGACLTTTLAMAYGLRDDPAVVYAREVVLQHFELFGGRAAFFFVPGLAKPGNSCSRLWRMTLRERRL